MHYTHTQNQEACSSTLKIVMRGKNKMGWNNEIKKKDEMNKEIETQQNGEKSENMLQTSNYNDYKQSSIMIFYISALWKCDSKLKFQLTVTNTIWILII